jgi:formamidase
MRDIDLTTLRFLGRPIEGEGAGPDDLLVVDLLDIGPVRRKSAGFNGFFSRNEGGASSPSISRDASKSVWDISGFYTHSRHMPGVQLTGRSTVA